MNLSTPAAAPTYRDRRTALLVAGILEIVLGAGAWLMVGLIFLGARFAQTQGGANTASMIPGMVIYGGGGALFILLGIGSIRLRRWARALWLVLSVGWMLFGFASLAGMFYWLPAMLNSLPTAGANGPQLAAIRIVMVITMAFMLFLMIVVPLTIFLFYRSPHVRATIEVAEPTPSWTDRCPMSVLGAAVWLGVTALCLIPMPFAYGGFFPLFGRFVDGAAGYGLWWGAALVSLVAAIGLAARQVWAWTLAVAEFVFLGAGALVTYARADLRQMYEAMGLAGAQLDQIERMGLLQPGFLITTTVVSIVPFLVLLVWARISLARATVPSPAAAPAPTSPGGATEG